MFYKLVSQADTLFLHDEWLVLKRLKALVFKSHCSKNIFRGYLQRSQRVKKTQEYDDEEIRNNIYY